MQALIKGLAWIVRVRRGNSRMKQVKATPRVLRTYENKHKKLLRCSKCGRTIKSGESVSRTTHCINYYCSDCSRIIEI